MEEGKEFKPLTPEEYKKMEGITPEIEADRKRGLLNSMEKDLDILEDLARRKLPSRDADLEHNRDDEEKFRENKRLHDLLKDRLSEAKTLFQNADISGLDSVAREDIKRHVEIRFKLSGETVRKAVEEYGFDSEEFKFFTQQYIREVELFIEKIKNLGLV